MVRSKLLSIFAALSAIILALGCCGCSTRKQVVRTAVEDLSQQTATVERTEITKLDSLSLFHNICLDSIEVVIERPVILDGNPDTILTTRISLKARSAVSTSSVALEQGSTQNYCRQDSIAYKRSTDIQETEDSERVGIVDVRNICGILVLVGVICVIAFIARRISP